MLLLVRIAAHDVTACSGDRVLALGIACWQAASVSCAGKRVSNAKAACLLRSSMSGCAFFVCIQVLANVACVVVVKCMRKGFLCSTSGECDPDSHHYQLEYGVRTPVAGTIIAAHA